MRLIYTLIASLLVSTAYSQSVQQSGNVTPGHASCWAITGVLYDCGAPGGGVSVVGSTTTNDFVAFNASGSLIDSGINPANTSNISGLWNFNGGATAPTRPAGDNSTNVATTAFANAIAANPAAISIAVTTNVNSILCAASAGSRAPIYVCNDNNGTSAAGYALTFEGWVGNNPVGSIAADNAVAIFQYIDNSGGRQSIWAMNFVCNQLPVALGGSVVINHCQENDVTQSQAATTPTNPFSAGPVTHGYEAVCSNNGSATPFPCQAAYWALAAGDYANNAAAGTQPFNFGYAAARSQYGGFGCADISGDTGTYFKQGCVSDQSHSNSVIKDAGVHNYFIDLTANPTFTYFVQGPTSAQANLIFGNQNNFNFYMQCQAGGSAEEECGWFYEGKTSGGVVQYWKFFKDTSNNMRMTNLVTGHIVQQWQNNDNVVLGANSGAPTTINAAGQVSIGNSIIYGGVTLSNSVTGTGSMVLGTSPAITSPTLASLTTFSGQFISTFGATSIASGACGATTNGTVAGTNASGLITIGAAATTTCTVSFSTTITAPGACVIFPANGTAAVQGTTLARVSSVGTTNFVITGSALALSNYYYICL